MKNLTLLIFIMSLSMLNSFAQKKDSLKQCNIGFGMNIFQSNFSFATNYRINFDIPFKKKNISHSFIFHNRISTAKAGNYKYTSSNFMSVGYGLGRYKPQVKKWFFEPRIYLIHSRWINYTNTFINYRAFGSMIILNGGYRFNKLAINLSIDGLALYGHNYKPNNPISLKTLQYFINIHPLPILHLKYYL